jgi:glycerol-3-phosphate dehydrogenase (NAD(P)+)
MEPRGNMKSVSILGSGSWALALSKILKPNKLVIKCRDIKKEKAKFKSHNIILTDSFDKVIQTQTVFIAIPSQSVRQNLIDLRQYKTSQQEKKIFVICSKGVEKNTFKLMSEVVSEIFPTSMISVLSGPNFSSELIKQKPSASVLSSKNKSVLKEISGLVIQEKFRTYFNNDIIGTQIGGAMKNIIAIACGYINGCGLGENAKAAIITRGLSEIIDLGIKMGARRNTFYGLSGIGDLTLSCSSLKSRNAKFGFNLAKSKSHSNRNILLEGIESCESICALGEKLNVDLPISKSVKSIIHGRNANKVICELLSRPLQFEK